MSSEITILLNLFKIDEMEDWPNVSEIWEHKEKKYRVYIVFIYEQWHYPAFRAFIYSTRCDKKTSLREQSIKEFLEQYQKVEIRSGKRKN